MARAILADITPEESKVPEIGHPKLCYCCICTRHRWGKMGKLARAWRKLACKKEKVIMYEPALINFPVRYATYSYYWAAVTPFVPETAAALIIQYIVPNSYMQVIFEAIGCNIVSTGLVDEQVLCYWHYPAVVNGVVRFWFWCHMKRSDIKRLFSDLEDNHLFATKFNAETNEVEPDPDFELSEKFGNLRHSVYEVNENGSYENHFYSFEPDAVVCDTVQEAMYPRDNLEFHNGGAWITYWDTVEQIREYISIHSSYVINENDL